MNSLFKLVFIFFILICKTADSKEKPIIISGYDDVLRQAENTSLLRATLKAFAQDKTFNGMPELYTVISNNRPNPKFYLVSAITSLFDERIHNFLNATGYPPHQRHLRNWLTEWSISNFKIKKMKEILVKNPQSQFIIILDNSDASLSFAKEVRQNFSNEVQSIYLRQVVQKDNPESTIRFYTAFDIAVNEYKLQRLSISELEKVGNSITNESRVDLLFPTYAICPKDYTPCDETQTETKSICDKVQTHVRALCDK